MNRFTGFLIFWLFLSFSSYSQNEEFEIGKVINQVPVKNSSDTFSLYLPTKFNPNQLSSIVFIFDPSGNGNNGINVFVEAAERFNYILVCSNATKNGRSYEVNFAAANALFKTIFSTFSIDEKQMYAAGFSGGSRLASSIAALTNQFQAVIACGAGMTINNAYKPKENMFSFIGLVGDRDMNYQEMLNTKKSLDKVGVTNELLIYEDTHRWPPKKQIERAFEWIELRAYQKQIRKFNRENVSILYKKQYHIADSLFKEKRYIRALSEYKHLQVGFQHFLNTDSIRKKIQQIEALYTYKVSKKRHLQYLELENKLFQKFSSVYKREIQKGVSEDKFAWWKRELKKLNQLISDAKTIGEKSAYERLLFSLQAGTYESSISYNISKDYKRALYCDKLSSLLRPNNAYFYYRLAVSYARNNNFLSTIKNLKKSKELNFRYFQRTQNTPEFVKYKQRKKFLQLYH
ncbi:hypothetical protein AAON49_02310 [Pseudotenacibaculum sp. MALMAid0570]|uniref:hypothetical protein n=1 Tax=Pseudotenacibaculum sp. MALMAid0570 TaxID=3143938 RepID=UPI0032DE6990